MARNLRAWSLAAALSRRAARAYAAADDGARVRAFARYVAAVADLDSAEVRYRASLDRMARAGVPPLSVL